MRKAILHLKKNDPVLRSIIEQVGPYRIEYSPAEFETLARSIVNQQLSGKVAMIMYGRLEAACRGKVTAKAVLRLPVEDLRGFGLSKQKTAYIRDLAEKTVAGEIDFAKLQALPDEVVMEKLTSIKGIGPWTVHMFLMFGLQRHNVMPTGDLGIRVAIKKAYRFEELPKPTEIDRMAEKWHPYCSVASWYLWRSLEDKNGL
jgi:3-methyladenine DNA glycosylase/8-oxoguanine DNA glycosylase